MATQEGAPTNNGSEEEICSICLEELKKPVELPCGHSFCSACLDEWRSKYTFDEQRKCPHCRATLPPTREMVGQLQGHRCFLKTHQSILSKPGPIPVPKLPSDPDYDDNTSIVFRFPETLTRLIRSLDDDPEGQQLALRSVLQTRLEKCQETLARLEGYIGDSEQVLSYSTGEDVEDLPYEINRAAGTGDTPRVLDWLGPRPVPAKRINARCRQHMDRTLLHEAEFENRIGLMSILLQLGADVDPKSAFGMTPLGQAATYNRLDEAARLLLTWGAAVNAKIIEETDDRNKKLKLLLQTPLGGRRCQIVGLQGRVDLNGKTGVATKYVRKKERYAFILEETEETVAIRPANLKRRDRTPKDCGKFFVYKGMRSDGAAMYACGLCFRSTEEADRYKSEQGH